MFVLYRTLFYKYINRAKDNKLLFLGNKKAWPTSTIFWHKKKATSPLVSPFYSN